MVVRDAAARPQLFAKLNTMHTQESLAQQQNGISRAMMDFVIAASQQRQLAIYRRYLDDDEFAYLSANLGRRAADWPPLIARVHRAMEQGCGADTPAAQALAREWLELFRSFAGDNPVTQQKIRQALTQEPAMRDFIRAALGSLTAGQSCRRHIPDLISAPGCT